MNKHTVLAGLMIWAVLLPSFATYDISLELWENVNMTTQYVNEFMNCWFENETHLYWDSYQSGEAEFNLAEFNDTWDISCCDNCQIVGSTIQLAPNSLNFVVDSNVSITTNTDLDYYIGDVLEGLRLAFLAGNTSIMGVSSDILAGVTLIIVCALGFGWLTMELFVGTNKTKMVPIGVGLGYLVGLILASAFDLFSFGQAFGLFIVGLFFMWILKGVASG